MSELRSSVTPVDVDAQRQYRVIGPQRVHGTRPGELFTAVLDPGQEAFLVEVGHIELVRLAQSDATDSADSAEQE